MEEAGKEEAAEGVAVNVAFAGVLVDDDADAENDAVVVEVEIVAAVFVAVVVYDADPMTWFLPPCHPSERGKCFKVLPHIIL